MGISYVFVLDFPNLPGQMRKVFIVSCWYLLVWGGQKTGDCGLSGAVFPSSSTVHLLPRWDIVWLEPGTMKLPLQVAAASGTGQWMRVMCWLHVNHLTSGWGAKSKVFPPPVMVKQRGSKTVFRRVRQSVASWESGFLVSLRHCGLWESNPGTSESRHLLYILFFFLFNRRNHFLKSEKHSCFFFLKT